jgi:ankyrin repeat protein
MTGKVDIDMKDDRGQTPLLCAARNWHEKVVKLLLETGRCDVNSKDDNGQTPLSHACGSEHKYDWEDEDESEDEYNRTQRSYVVGSEAVVKLLLATRKVDIDSKDEE